MAVQATRGNVARRRCRSVEWPSVILCAAVYGGFGALTFLHDRLAAPLVAALGAVLIVVHASMQHEFIHGHPTPSHRLNRWLGFVPLNLWLPFESYRMTHLVHHCDEALTDPLDDPETYYWSAQSWAALGPVGRGIVRAHTTLAGRLLIGPAWNIGRFLLSEARGLAGGDSVRRRIWAGHVLGVAGVLVWVVGVCQMNLAFYLLAIVYPGTSVLLLRSFAEHRAQEGVFERTAIVENSWVFGPLFLFNNLHAAHHERPLMPWYALPGWYKANRSRLLAGNGELVYDGYADVVRRFLFTPHDVNVHPLPPSATGAGGACQSA